MSLARENSPFFAAQKITLRIVNEMSQDVALICGYDQYLYDTYFGKHIHFSLTHTWVLCKYFNKTFWGCPAALNVVFPLPCFTPFVAEPIRAI